MAVKGIRVDGLEYVEDMMARVSVREGRRANANATHAMARKIVVSSRLKAPRGRTGTLRKAIMAKRGRPTNRDRPFSDVVITHGRSARHDAWYWRFVEYGTQPMTGGRKGGAHAGLPARPFIQPARDEVAANYVAIFREEFYYKMVQQMRKRRR